MILTDFYLTGIALVVGVGLYLLISLQNISRANPNYGLIYGMLGFVALVGVLSPLAFAILRMTNHDNASVVVWIIAAAFLFGAALTVILAVYSGGSYDQHMKELLAGDFWAHWVYTPEEQYSFASSEALRQFHNARNYAFYSLALAVVGGLLAGLIASGTGRGLPIGVLAAGVFLAGGALVVGVTYLDSLLKKVRMREGKEQQGGETFINAKGMYFINRYTPFFGFNLWLDNVSLLEGNPGELVFCAVSRRRYGTTTQEIRLPVPQGKLEEAQALVEKFQRILKKSSPRQ